MASLNVIGGEIRSQPLNENFQNINTELTAHESATTNVHGIADTANLARGILGYAQVTASQSGITTEVALTGLSVTVNVAANRRIKISGSAPLSGTVNGDRFQVRIKEGATMLQGAEALINTVYYYPAHPTIVITPPAGAHTYNLTCARLYGTGSAEMYAASSAPAYILVEDIGPA